MCAITGVINFNDVIREKELIEIRFLLSRMAHRGPEASSLKLTGSKGVLGSNRLRITDCKNPKADMPLTTPDGFAIVFNGEVYNHRELRKRLEIHFSFKTNSDSEVVLASYCRWGVDCVHHIDGMFSFCVYDPGHHQFFLARDPSGQKPLYFMHSTDYFLFASEIEALIANPFRKKTWSIDGISEYVCQRMILGTDTHIKQIQKLESGCALRIDIQGNVTHRRYYKVPIGDQNYSDIKTVTERIIGAVEQSVRATLDLQVPFGLFLSGGIDSTALLALMKKYDRSPNTYSIGFKQFSGENFGIDSTFDEFEYSRLAAERYCSNHKEFSLSIEDYSNLIDQWAQIMGEPLDSSEAPYLIYLFNKAAKCNDKVIFCGSGPDEIFDGYGFGKHLADSSPELLAEQYYDRFAWNFSVDLQRLLPDNNVRARIIAKLNTFLHPYRQYNLTPLQLSQLINFHGRCVDYEYRQMDVISMQHSIEVRTPFAEKSITEQAFAFCPELKQHMGVDKWIFKKALKRLVPKRIYKRKKVGIPTPIEYWFTNCYEEKVSDILNSNGPLNNLGIFNLKYFQQMWSTRRPEYRCIDYRLYLLHKLLEHQSELMHSFNIDSLIKNKYEGSHVCA